MLSDRHYMRPKRSGMVDGVSPVTAILWINIAVFILQHVFNVWTTPILGAAGQPVIDRDTGEALTRLQGSVSLSDLAAGKVYLLITSMFVHGGILHIVGNMLIVFFFGSRLLEFFGPKHFLGVYFLGGIGGALLQLAASAPGTPLIGASGGAFALVCAFATILPEMEIVAALYFVVPVRLKMKYLGLGLALGSLVLAMLSRVFGWWGDIGHLAHLGGCLVGWYYARVLGYGGKPLPFFGFKRGGQGRDPSRRAEGLRRPGGRSVPIRKAEILDADVVENPAGLKEQMDQVLDKINREGFQSLTPKEKQILEKGSEHMGRQARRK